MIETISQLQPLGQVARVIKQTVHPASFGEQPVAHYSLPAFDDRQGPSVVKGADIKSPKILLNEPVVLISRLNPHIPRVWAVFPGDLPALSSTEFVALAPEGVSIGYLYAACLSDAFSSALRSLVTGTSTSHQRVKHADMLDLKLPIPGLDVQEGVGQLVLALEERMQLIEKSTRSLDKLTSTLFRSSFPGVFDGQTPLGDLVSITMGVSYRSADLRASDEALVTLKSFGRDGSYRAVGLKEWAGVCRDDQYLDEGDVVVAHTDLTQAADVLGRSVVVPRSGVHRRLAASLDMAIVRPRQPITREFLIGLTRQEEFRQYCRSNANGTTVLHLSRKAVAEFRFRPPSGNEVTEYSRLAGPLIRRQMDADHERQLLRSLRDRVVSSAVT